MYKDLYVWLNAMPQKAINFTHLHIPKVIHKVSHWPINCILDIYNFCVFDFIHKFNIQLLYQIRFNLTYTYQIYMFNANNTRIV